MEYITGVVIYGKQQGRALGFPTANVKLDAPLLVDAGIYAGCVLVDEKKYQAALYIAGSDVVEAFLLDFSGDLYGAKVGVQIGKKIRGVTDFKSATEAKEQITKDVIYIRELLSRD